MIPAIILTIAISYLLGNVNGSIIISRLLEKDDVRSHGSGNAGFTNFFRNYGGINSLIVILIDALKSSLACIIGGWLLGKYGLRMEGMTLGGLFVCLGHDFPALLNFRGGKGIISGFAAVITIDWRIAVFVGIAFLIAYLLTYYVSLGSLAGAATYCIGFIVVYHNQPVVMVLGAAIAVLAIVMHHQNIGRLIKGTETKTNFFKRGK